MSSKQGGASSVLSLLTSKSLSNMVKGIRAHKTEHAGNAHAEAEYIAKCMAEIKAELQTNFPDVKAVAVQKLIYLQMVSDPMKPQSSAAGDACAETVHGAGEQEASSGCVAATMS